MFVKRYPVLAIVVFTFLSLLVRQIVTLVGQPYTNERFGSPISDTIVDPGTTYGESFSNSNSSPVETFASAFTKAVYSSEVLSDLFNMIQTTPSAFSKFLYDGASDVLLNHKFTNPHLIANTLSQPVAKSFTALTLPLMVKAYANAMAKILFDEGVLNASNALLLASAYCEEMKNKANLYIMAGNPESKFKALYEGYVNFLATFGLFVPEKFADIASGFGDEFDKAVKLMVN